jgi:branched-chain amino acid transport system ATP-binding protein
MLEVKNISSGYGKKQVLDDVSFTVEDNEIVLLTGGNGSGKSTVLKCIYGLLKIWNKDGKIIFNGKKISGLHTSEMVKQGIVYIPQKNNYFESLTIEENLSVSGSIYSKVEIKQRMEDVYKLPGLYDYRKRTPFNLSGGERQLLALGIGLMHKPKLILFDEPLAGLDESNTKVMISELLKLKEQKISMLIVEHKETINSFSDKKLKMYLGEIKNE